MFGMSAERSVAQRPPRIAQCGHAPRIDSGGTPPAPEARRRSEAKCDNNSTFHIQRSAPPPKMISAFIGYFIINSVSIPCSSVLISIPGSSSFLYPSSAGKSFISLRSAFSLLINLCILAGTELSGRSLLSLRQISVPADIV